MPVSVALNRTKAGRLIDLAVSSAEYIDFPASVLMLGKVINQNRQAGVGKEYVGFMTSLGFEGGGDI